MEKIDVGKDSFLKKKKKEKEEKLLAGPTEIWTRIAGFRVQSASHYTMGPYGRRSAQY